MAFLKRFLINFLVALIVLLVIAQISFAQPSDIKGHWAEKIIADWTQKGLIAGYPDGSFRPNEKVTRVEFAAMVNKVFGFVDKAGISFADVAETDWYYDHVSIAIKAGFMAGYPEGVFLPGKILTRQEATEVICKAMRIDIEGQPDRLAGFRDAKDIGNEYKPYVNAAVAEGLMEGFPDGSFRPGGTLTRAEMVVLLDKITEVLPDIIGETDVTPPIYTALGDSIAFGYGVDPEKSYVARFYNYLKTLPDKENIKLYNFSEVGADTSILLKRLQSDEAVREAISKSDVITISIGGNNLLQPVIDLVCRAFDVEPGDYDQIGTDLMLAVLFNPERDRIINELMEPENIPSALSDGVERFKADWDIISKEIEVLAPNARVYVTTLYNPFPKNPDDQLYVIFDGFVREINAVINMSEPYYKVVDIYPLFSENPDNPEDRLTQFNLFSGRLDPHPNEKGHQAIFQCHLDKIIQEVR